RGRPRRAPVLRRRAPGGGARRHADHGGRRPHAAAPRGDTADDAGPVSHPGMLPPDRRGPLRRLDPGRGGRGNAAVDDVGTARPGHRPRPVRLHGEEEAGGLLLMAVPGETGCRDLLRFLTCGSVDDGKSTLIGRLLYESGMLPDDQMAALEAESRTTGTRGGGLDFALLVDGLAA